MVSSQKWSVAPGTTIPLVGIPYAVAFGLVIFGSLQGKVKYVYWGLIGYTLMLIGGLALSIDAMRLNNWATKTKDSAGAALAGAAVEQYAAYIWTALSLVITILLLLQQVFMAFKQRGI